MHVTSYTFGQQVQLLRIQTEIYRKHFNESEKEGGGQVFNEKKKQVTSIREGRKHGLINYKDSKQ